MITLHHLNQSRSHRILWLLEELGLDYEIVRYERNPKTMLAPRELREVHPLGKSPVITDGDVTVAESGAIIEYLLDRYGEGRLRPEMGTPEYLRYRYWMHYAEGSAMTPLLLSVVFGELPRQGPKLAYPVLKSIATLVGKQYINPQIKLHMQYWEEELAKAAFFVGDEFSAADIQMSFALEGALDRGGNTEGFNKIRALVGKLKQRSAYKRAVEKGA